MEGEKCSLEIKKSHSCCHPPEVTLRLPFFLDTTPIPELLKGGGGGGGGKEGEGSGMSTVPQH